MYGLKIILFNNDCSSCEVFCVSLVKYIVNKRPERDGMKHELN